MEDKKREPGVSTDPGESYMDKIQESVQETGEGPDGESMNVGGSAQHASDEKESQPVSDNKREVEVDKDALEILEPQPEPKQVEETYVIFVPHKDFEARVNQDIFHFRTDVPTRVTRDVAAMLTEDKSRGYIRK